MLIFGLLSSAVSAETFSLTAALEQGTLTGTLTLDTQSGTVVDSDLVFTLDGKISSIIGSAYVFSASPGLTGIYDVNFEGEGLSLILPVPTLIGYSGGETCGLEEALCFIDPTHILVSAVYTNLNEDPVAYSFYTGSLTPMAPTPEIGSIALLGTGFVGLVGVLRKQKT